MSAKRTPWAWVPTLYFAEGLPYVAVNLISVTMFKRLGMPNGELALFTSLLYLPWVIKPLWSPVVDVRRTKRWWIMAMQLIMSIAFAALAFSVASASFALMLTLFYISAFASATHDIAADGYYMIELDAHRQSLFVGIRSTFYRIATVFGQGVLVVFAGVLEERLGNIPRAWTITLLLCSAILGVITLWHHFMLPHPADDTPRENSVNPLKDMGQSVVSFFRKPGIWAAMVFLLLFRLPEALSVKMLTPFLLDPVEDGGLGLSTTDSGLVYGTVGVVALTLGGIAGGLAAGRFGLRKCLWPMALSLALPCSVYLYMALAQPASLWIVYFCVALDQFGYGFGFTAYMLYMIYFSDGPFKTSHYALCTAFMALSMMIPGIFAGYLQEWLGYGGFFALVMVLCLCTVGVTFLVKVDSAYGKKNETAS
ncbi:MAG: MFS transporter [Bacteroidales bacterium]|nr:MFS transporter [Bacteroidales bacterium]